MPAAVSNSTPLISLSVLGHLELLRELYGEVWIPPSVQREVVVAGRGRSGSSEVAAAIGASWIRVVAPADEQLVARLRERLDLGEAEAIALALTTDAETLVIDEIKGRRTAADYGINLAGTVGILTDAARDGKIDALQADLDHLRQFGVRISQPLYRWALDNSQRQPNR